MSADRRGERAQLTIDFAVAAGTFLLAVAFVFAFVPGMLSPFEGGQSQSLVADRAASQLAEGTLGDPSTPYVLNTTCTLELFRQVNGGSSATDTCRFDTTAATVHEILGVDETTRVNVTVERNVTGTANPEIVCRDGTTAVVDDCSTGVPLAAGPSPPPSAGQLTGAYRSVIVDGGRYDLHVRVW